MTISAIDAPLLSILIVNYNGRKLLGECLDTVLEHCSVPCEVIICDNASTDGSVPFLRAEYPQVQIIERPTNEGFSVGVNRAAAQARGAFLLILNSDTVTTSDVGALIDLVRSGERIGVVGYRVTYRNGETQESIGQEPRLWRLLTTWLPVPGRWPLVRHLKLVASRTDVRYGSSCVDVPWVSGVALLIPTAVWQAVRGFDESYFMYVEDIDLCERVKGAGWRVVFSADASVIHLEHGKHLDGGAKALAYTVVSFLTYVRRRHGTAAAWGVRWTLPGLLVLRAFAYLVAGGWVATPPSRWALTRAYVATARGLFRGRLA